MQTFTTAQEDLCTALHKRIKDYKIEHPRLSSTQIAHKFGLSTSTFSRIENKEIRNPAIDQVIRVLRGVGANDDIINFINEFYPGIAETYNEVYSSFINGNNFVSPGFEEFLTSRDTFLIMILAASQSGTTKLQVKNLFGEKGFEELQKLLDEKVLIEDFSGNISLEGKSSNVSLSQEGSKKLFQLVLDHCYRTESFGTGENFLILKTESLNRKKVHPEIIKILKETHRKLQQVMDNPDNYGEDHIFIGLLSDSII